MFDEIARLVRLILACPIARIILVIAGMHEKNVATLDMNARFAFPILEMLRRIYALIANAHLLQIYNHCRTKELVDRNAADILPIGDEV